MKKLIYCSIILILIHSNKSYAQKLSGEENNGCNAIGIGDLKNPNKYDFYPRFTDTNIPLQISVGKTINVRMYISCFTGKEYKDLPMNGKLTDDKGNTITTWNEIFNYTFNTAGAYFLSYTSLCNNAPCKAGTKTIIVKSNTASSGDMPPIKNENTTENTFLNSLDISTGRKYYAENNRNKNVVREANWQLVSGPPTNTAYPTYGYTILGSLSAETSNYNAPVFKGAHWLTITDGFAKSNMTPYVPYKFVKKFETKQADNIYIQLQTLYDNHLAIYIDGKRLFLHHPIKNVETIINKPTPIRDDYNDRRETFNYAYNASYFTKADGTIYLNAGTHEVVAELTNAAQEIGFIISGEITSASGMVNNFLPISFTMPNLIKEGNYNYENESLNIITQAPPYRTEAKLESEKWTVKFKGEEELKSGAIIKLKKGSSKKIQMLFIQSFYNGDFKGLEVTTLTTLPNGQINTFYNGRKFYFTNTGSYIFNAEVINSTGAKESFSFTVTVE